MINNKENLGIFFGALAFFLFASSDVLQKYATINHTVFQIIFFRYLFLLLISFFESVRKKNKIFYKTNNLKLQLSRSITIVISDHAFENVLQIADDIKILSDGYIISEGSPSSVVADVRAREKYFGVNY